MRDFTKEESNSYTKALESLLSPTGRELNFERGIILDNKLINILKNLVIAANELDSELCTICSRGIKEGASMTGNRYEELMDYIIEAEDYLKEQGVDVD
ncbi:hypothetical protein HUB98_05930 [Paenibacillus barcinonensis]|uniref:Uncharacterized protein n=1 Tax=Paenibacillus barcinonensis TaxID=198119 RepID=A0A2V4VEP4_PAEBA|nr:hypothetical protein [Paenibacillus barcinonensis]PYE51544.1 hypothetical protein DFQ00_102338 [Paenibacillus barcinonensis]QKS55920.1 hypothetical protein HUB98_05930 [Paenibacillus barcinonensis]